MTNIASPFPSENDSHENLSLSQDSPLLNLTVQSTLLVYLAPSWLKYARLSPAPIVMVLEDLPVGQVIPPGIKMDYCQIHTMNVLMYYVHVPFRWSVVVGRPVVVVVVVVVVLLSPDMRVPVQTPRGKEVMLVTSSGLIMARVSMGAGWKVSRSLLISSSSVCSPSTLPFPLHRSYSTLEFSSDFTCMSARSYKSQLGQQTQNHFHSHPKLSGAVPHPTQRNSHCETHQNRLRTHGLLPNGKLFK